MIICLVTVDNERKQYEEAEWSHHRSHFPLTKFHTLENIQHFFNIFCELCKIWQGVIEVRSFVWANVRKKEARCWVLEHYEDVILHACACVRAREWERTRTYLHYVSRQTFKVGRLWCAVYQHLSSQSFWIFPRCQHIQKTSHTQTHTHKHKHLTARTKLQRFARANRTAPHHSHTDKHKRKNTYEDFPLPVAPNIAFIPGFIIPLDEEKHMVTVFTYSPLSWRSEWLLHHRHVMHHVYRVGWLVLSSKHVHLS